MTENPSAPTGVWERVLPELQYVRQPYPRAAIEAARAARAKITPHLLRLLDGWVADPSPTFEDGYFLHLFAIGLLAEWRETRAYRPLVALATQSEEVGDQIFGDAAGEVLDRALASVCDGDDAPLHALMGNEEVSVWLRVAALDALVVRAAEGDADLSATRAFLLQAGQEEAARLRATDDGASLFLGFVVAALADIGARDALPEIRGWYRDRLIDESVVGLAETERDARLSDAELLANARRARKTYIADAAALYSDWYCFTTEFARGQAIDDTHHDDELPPGEPYVRSAPKIGRNDPCPCGSGKKFKKCHGAAA